MTKVSWLLAAVLLVTLSGTAVAEVQNQMTWYPGYVAGSWNGYGTSPYLVTDLTFDPDQKISLYCLDFNHYIHPPNAWTADINALEEPNLSHYLYGSVLTWDIYREIAWLFEMTQTADADTKIAAQVAVWGLTAHGARLTTYTDLLTNHSSAALRTKVSDLLIAAAAKSDAPTNWSVVTANSDWEKGYFHVTGDNSDPYLSTHVQEFMVNKSAGDFPGVPEPASVLLLGAVLVGCGRRLAKRWA